MLLADFLPLRSAKPDGAVVLAHDQCGGRGDVGFGEIVLRLALGRDTDLVDHHVVAVDVQARDQAVPLAFHKLGFHAELFGNGAADVHVKAHELVVGRLMEGEGCVSAFGADAEGARLLDGGEVIALGEGRSLDQERQTRETDGEPEFLKRFMVFSLRGARLARQRIKYARNRRLAMAGPTKVLPYAYVGMRYRQPTR